jgi:hypothetical protein
MFWIREDRREAIFRSDADGVLFLATLSNQQGLTPFLHEAVER